MLLDSPMKIDVLHGREGVAIIESIDFREEVASNCEVAGPQISARFVDGSDVRKAGWLSHSAYAPFKDADVGIFHGRVPIYRNQVLVRNTIVVEKNEKL